VSTRVSKIANVIIPAGQDRAPRFCTEASGLQRRAGTAFGDGNRWIEAPSGAGTSIAICPPVRRDTGRKGHWHLAPHQRHQRMPRVAERAGVDADAEAGRFGDDVHRCSALIAAVRQLPLGPIPSSPTVRSGPGGLL
jgi:hypothetical protein